MQAGQAKRTAARWFRDVWTPALERSGKAHGCHGAYIMGSLAGRAEDADFDADASDIDVAILVDPVILPPDHERYPHGSFTLFEDCAIQAIFVPVPALLDEESLLGMLGLGCNLLRAHVLSDPDGRFRAATQVIQERWGDPEWLARRTERATNFAQKAVAALPRATGPVERLAALGNAVMQLAGLLPIADGVPPTHRRALALAGERLHLRGRDDLTDRLLATIGASDVSAADVDAALDDALLALALEARYDTSANLSAELRANLPRMLTAGVRDITQEGLFGAAMLPALLGVSESANATQDATAEDAAVFDSLATAALRRTGIPPDSWETRCGAVADLLEELVEITSPA